MKSNNTHALPLPPWSRQLISAAIAEAKGNYVFPSPKGDAAAPDAQHIDRHASSKALSRAQRPQTFMNALDEVDEADVRLDVILSLGDFVGLE